MISLKDLMEFVDEALDGMVAIVVSLGNERVNCRLDGKDANSPYGYSLIVSA